MTTPPQKRQVGAPEKEVEITPEMISVAARILEGRVFPHGAIGGAAEDLAKDVLEGVFRVPRRPC